MYFKLNSYVYIVTGEAEGCMYDLQKGHVYKFSTEISEKIVSLERGMPVEEVGLDESTLRHLIDLGLGELYEHNVYVDKIRYGVSQNVKNMMFQQNRIHSLFLQIENKCNMDCIFCDERSCNKITGCRKYVGESKLSIENYSKILNDAKKLGCLSLTLIGGEPLLQKELVTEIIECAKKLEYKEIYLYTNAYLLDEKFINKNRGIVYVIQALACNQEILEKVNKNGKKVEDFFRAVELLANCNIRFVFYLSLTEQNYKYKDEMMDFYKKYKPSKILCNYIYQESNDADYNNMLLCNSFRDDIQIQDKQFLHNLDNHPCLFGKISVFANGDIGVCPMMRNRVISNFFEEDLWQILLKKKQEKFWKLSLDKIDVCGKCAMRYACFDCRAIEEERTGKIDGKYYCKKV